MLRRIVVIDFVDSGTENIGGFAQTERNGRIVFHSGDFSCLLGESTNIRRIFSLSPIEYKDLLRNLDEHRGKFVCTLPLRASSLRVAPRDVEVHDGGQYLFWLVGQQSTKRPPASEFIEQHQKLRTVLDNAPIGIWIQNNQGKLEFVNKAFCAATGISEEKLLAAPHYREVIPEEYKDIFLSADEKALTSDRPWIGIQQLPFADGLPRDLQVIKTVHRNPNGEPLALIGLAIDITDQRRQEAALNVAQRHVRQLAIKENRKRLDERRQIAQYLHDDLGQTLTSLSMTIEHLASLMNYPEEVAEKFDGVFEKLSEALLSTRRVTMMLRPPFALEQGLLFAVRILVNRLTQSGAPQISVEIPDSDRLRLPANEDIILNTYRVIQESLTNAFRHAKARQVSIKVDIDDASLRAVIQDDGYGFQVDRLKYCSGIGILGMRERAELLGGRLDVDSASGQGTRVVLSLPFGKH